MLNLSILYILTCCLLKTYINTNIYLFSIFKIIAEILATHSGAEAYL